jgi:hypothetical protein
MNLQGRIITSNVYPPIPDRRWDWCAYHDGDEENSHLYGWGTTEQEAIDDLRRLEGEYAEAEDDQLRFEYETKREG